MDNPNRYGYTYAKIHILLIVSLLKGRCLTRLHQSTYDNGKKVRLIIPNMVVETGYWHSGESVLCSHDRSADEND